MTRNPVGWFEIYVQDMDRAKAFYENVLSRTLEALAPPGADSSDMEMWAFPMQPEAGGAAGALVHMPGAPSGNGGTLIYFSCDDCAVEAGRAVAQGGTVVRDKMPIGPYGFIALITDPDENLIGLHSMRQGLAPGVWALQAPAVLSAVSGAASSRRTGRAARSAARAHGG